ncbi:MAG TPA: murein biosynthesis integral membrane protein MurJ [Candidatus Saccharimonadales bacterium]|nr:murein biosynthesis integral membrane protein MurJ [Candidatus Saccharimonadales bacterium]
MVNKLLSRSSSLILRRQNSIISAAVIMMILMLASRVLGLFRNWFLARYFGASGTLDAYNAAFVFPDLLTNVLITGALSAAFIPIFTDYLAKKKYQESEILASTILNLSLIVFGIIAVIIFLFPAQLNYMIGIRLDPRYALQAAQLTRVVIFGELILIVASFLTSVLQSYHRFLVAAIAPVVYNLGVIFGIVVLSRSFGILGVGLGVVIGAVCHATIQLFALNSIGFHYRQVMSFKNPDVFRVLKLSLPRAVSVGIGQLESIINVVLASSLAVGSIAVLEFATDLQNLPIGLFGVTIATAALPTLSMEWVQDKAEEFKKTFLNSFFQMLYLAVPVSVILAVLRIPIVRIVLGSGLFDWTATVATATTMSYFAIGVFAQAGFLLVTRAFYAMHDTVTPLKIAVAGLIFHALIGSFFIFGLGGQVKIPVAFLGLTTSLSGMFSFFILFFLLDRRLGGFGAKQILYPVTKIAAASLVMAVFLYVPLHVRLPGGELIIDYIIDTKRALNLLFLTGSIAIAGLALYGLLTWWFNSQELKAYLSMLPDFRKAGKLLDFEESVDSTPTSTRP